MFAFSKEGWDAGWDRFDWAWFAVALIIVAVYSSIPGHQHNHGTLAYMVLCGIGYGLLHWAKSGFEKGMQMVPEPMPLPESLAGLNEALCGWDPEHESIEDLRSLLSEGRKQWLEFDGRDLGPLTSRKSA